jgi:hypothetical protein
LQSRVADQGWACAPRQRAAMRTRAIRAATAATGAVQHPFVMLCVRS